MANSRRFRIGEAIAPFLRIAGAILLAAGMLHFYADRVIFEASPFAARAAASLGDGRVAGYVAERLTDEAIAQKRDLVGFRPLIVAAARALVASEPFRAGFRQAVRGAHTAIFSERGEQIALSVPDLGVLIRSALAHDPALASRVPPGLRGDLSFQPVGKVANGLVELVRLAHKFRQDSIVALVVAGLLLGLGIALPRDRRMALLLGGAALAAVGLVFFFLMPAVRTLLTVSMKNAELRPVVAGVWDAFTQGFRLWALVLAGLGVVLAAAASSFASHVEIEDVVRRAWTRLYRPAQTLHGEVLRATLLLGCGLTAAFQPSATLRGLTVIAGVILAFEGLRELFLLMPPRVPATADRAAQVLAGARDSAREWEGARTWMRSAAVALVLLAVITGATLFLRSPSALPSEPMLTDACNGDRALCDRSLDAVVFPTAHNSMSAADLDGWMFPNQEQSTVALLNRGIRGFLFDVHYGMPIAGRIKTDMPDEAASRAKFEAVIGKEAVDAAMRIRDRLTGAPTGPRAPYLCHAFCELGATPFQSMLEGVRDFLIEHPGEVLIFVIEDYVTPSDIAAAFRDSGLESYVYRGPVGLPFPTLRELIDTNQRVVVFGEKDPTGVPWLHPAFETIQETPYTFRTPEEFSCKPNRGGPSAPLFQINHWIQTEPPKPSNAEIVNAHDYLLARARKCQDERKHLPNILAVDFAETGDVVGVAATLNGLAP